MKSDHLNTNDTLNQTYQLFEKGLVKASDSLSIQPNPDSWNQLESMIDTDKRQSPRRTYSLSQWIKYAVAASFVLAVGVYGINHLSKAPKLVQEDLGVDAAPYFTSYLAASHHIAGYAPVLEGSRVNKLSPQNVPINAASEDTFMEL